MHEKPTYEELEQRIQELEKLGSKLERAEKALRQSDEKYKNIVENIEDGYYEVDIAGNFTLQNNAMCKILQYSKNELTGLNNRRYMDEENAKKVFKAFNKVYKTGQPYKAFDWELIRKDGSKCYVETSIALKRDLKGQPIGFQGIARDIGERKKTEKALRESEERYRTILESIEDAYFEVDLTGKLTFFNNSLCGITGLSSDELMGMKNRDYMDEDTTKRVYKAYVKVFETGKPVKGFEYQIQKGHVIKYVTSSVSLLLDSKSKPIGFRGILSDVTNQKKNEKERVKLQEQLQQAKKLESIGTLAGGIAHEFNNILGTIIGNTALAINDVPESNPARECLEEIQTASLRAKDVVRQLLGFARKSVFQLMPIEISPLVSETLKLIRASIPTTIEIRQNISCESDTVMADSSQFNQLLINLCTNAKNAMQENGGVLEVELEDTILDEKSATRYEDLSPGNYVKLTVRDTGTGIDPTIVDRIFDPYFTTTSLAEGAGMGLAVVLGIVKHHNGAITVASEPGKGAAFEVLFPLTEAEMAQEAGEPEALSVGAERILFIDDEESLVKLGRKMLNQLGYSVETKRNPIEALELVRSEPDRFDLIITDMTMPQMTGDKLAKEILSIRPDMPIILCSGSSEKIDDKKAQALGIRKYIEKPMDMSDFMVTVRKVLDEAKASAQQ